jgi:Icc-related predicted phosphoesterase
MPIRVAYFVDVHGRFDAVPRALREIGDVDAIVIGGDITLAGSRDEAVRAIEAWRALAPRLLCVAGNWDSPEIDDCLVELGVSLDGRGLVLGDVGLFGVSAAPESSLHTPYELDEEELGLRIEQGFAAVRDSRVRILCAHAPPSGTACDRTQSGQHVGSTAVRAIVEREQIDLVLCGHIHEGRGIDEIGTTRVVNPGPAMAGHYALVEVDDSVIVSLEA